MPDIEDEIKHEIERGEREENVYSEVAREELIDGGEISAEEEGFMKGYDDDIDSDDEEFDETDDNL